MDDRRRIVAPGARIQPPFQFSLRTLLIIATAVAVVCAALSASGFAQELAMTFVCVCWPVVLLMMVIYGRGYRRTFAIGAIFPAAMWMLAQMPKELSVWVDFFLGYHTFSGNSQSGDSHPARLIIFSQLAFSIAVGLVGMLARWMTEAPPEPRPASRPPLTQAVLPEEVTLPGAAAASADPRDGDATAPPQSPLPADTPQSEPPEAGPFG